MRPLPANKKTSGLCLAVLEYTITGFSERPFFSAVAPDLSRVHTSSSSPFPCRMLRVASSLRCPLLVAPNWCVSKILTPFLFQPMLQVKALWTLADSTATDDDLFSVRLKDEVSYLSSLPSFAEPIRVSSKSLNLFFPLQISN